MTVARRLAGRVAVVTGASTGLGRATAERLAREGAIVLITARGKADLATAAEHIGSQAVPVAGDITRDGDRRRLFDTIGERSGRLDVVVANAGAPFPARIEDYTETLLKDVLALNLTAVAFTVKEALPLMTNGGSIVLVSSIEGLRGSDGLGPYAATKAAQQSLARTWASELRTRQIRVNSISPGVVFTPAFTNAGVSLTDAEQAVPFIPAGRLGTAEEIAATIAFLASDEASFINATNVVVDGGQTGVI